MSIVRVGLSETKNYAEGYDLIFAKKGTKTKKAPPSTKRAPAKPKKKTAKKK